LVHSAYEKLLTVSIIDEFCYPLVHTEYETLVVVCKCELYVPHQIKQ